ncbi:MAG TPA: hypothetical protein VLT35_07250 [Methanocella sp.]|nr:hypothetical protein [Methanocella sp.]
MEIKTPTREERIALQKRGIKMIVVTALLGVLAGLLSSPYVLSQPIYGPTVPDGGSEYLTYPSAMLYHATVVTPDSSKPQGSFVDPGSAFLLKNSSILPLLINNGPAFMPNATVTHTNAIIVPGSASRKYTNLTAASILLTNVSVSLTDSADVPANASVLLNNGLVLLSDPADRGNASVLLSTGVTTRQVNPHASDHSSFGVLILALLIYVQKFIFPPLGIDSKRFGLKDWFFLSFMTFCFWIITWTLLLNGQPPAFGPFF